jgi:hypothetical protein
MKPILFAPLLLLGFASGACSTYQYAKGVKMVSFEDNVSTGRSIGPVRGESCQGSVMGYPIGEPATLDQAMEQAREKNHLRYMNNVSTENTGFDSFFYARRCLAVRGTGYE